MQNMLDRLGGREWRRWCRDLSKAAEKAVLFASEEANYRSPGPADEERRLTETGTEITRQWASLRERLVARQALDFSDRDISDLLQEATKRRVEAMGAASLVQSKNVGRRFYQPFYDRFQEMADYQVEIWGALLEVCESRDPNDLESVVQYLKYCESLGEQALGSVVKSTWSKSSSPESGRWPGKKGSSWRTGLPLPATA